MLGAQIGPYLERGELQLGLSLRTFEAKKQFLGIRENLAVMNLGTQVISKSDLYDLSVTLGLDRQWNLTLGQPFIAGSSNRALPATRAGAFRFDHSTHEFGDLSLVARRWMKDTRTAHKGNFSLGLGVKLPTGDEEHMDLFPDGRGINVRQRHVDPSILPGDGGLGILFDFQGFTGWGKRTLFASATYLANPRDQTRTLSPKSFLNPAGELAVPAIERYNTVGDAYLLRVGFTEPVEQVKGLSLVLAGRWEGVPQEDIFGSTIGFRRPGYVVAIEPGLIYSRGRTTFALSVPFTVQQNRQPNLGVPGDSTFADNIVLAGVTYRFGTGNNRSGTGAKNCTAAP